MSETAEQFIKDHGGAHALARTLGISPGAVRMWKVRKTIPRTVWPEIIDALPGVTLDDLRKVEAA